MSYGSDITEQFETRLHWNTCKSSSLLSCNSTAAIPFPFCILLGSYCMVYCYHSIVALELRACDKSFLIFGKLSQICGWSQCNNTSDFSRSLKGAPTGQVDNCSETVRSQEALHIFFCLGSGISWMALTFLGSIFRPSVVSKCPK